MNLTQYNNPEREPNLLVVALVILAFFTGVAWGIERLFN